MYFPALELTRWGDEPNGAKEENRTGHNRFVLKTTEAGGFWLETFIGRSFNFKEGNFYTRGRHKVKDRFVLKTTETATLIAS